MEGGDEATATKEGEKRFLVAHFANRKQKAGRNKENRKSSLLHFCKWVFLWESPLSNFVEFLTSPPLPPQNDSSPLIIDAVFLPCPQQDQDVTPNPKLNGEKRTGIQFDRKRKGIY